MDQPKRKASEAYLAKLRDPRWQRKRLEIMQRDGFACVWCKETELTLHIHHKFYTKGKDPWEYENWALITVCEQCHECEHDERPGVEKDFLATMRAMGLSTSDLLCLVDNMQRYESRPDARQVFIDSLDFMMMEPSMEVYEFIRKCWRAYASGERTVG